MFNAELGVSENEEKPEKLPLGEQRTLRYSCAREVTDTQCYKYTGVPVQN